jgi:hypothetical protein
MIQIELSDGVVDFDTKGFRFETVWIQHRFFDVELRLSPHWVVGNIRSTDVAKTCHTLNAYIFETNNREVIHITSLDSL